MQINATMRKKLTIPSVGKDVEQLELSYVAGGNAKNGPATLYNRITVSETCMYHMTQQFHTYVFTQRNECLCLHKHTDMNVQNSIILYAPNWKQSSGTLVGSQKEGNINTDNSMDESQKLYAK